MKKHRCDHYYIFNNKAFSMIELMITVVIVSVCLVMALRVYSLCAHTVSNASVEIQHIDVFRKKLDELYIKSINDNGLDPGTYDALVPLGSNKYMVNVAITEWNKDGASSDEAVASEDIKPLKIGDLLQTDISIGLGGAGNNGNDSIKVIIPSKGMRHEYY